MHQFHKFILSWNSTFFEQFFCPSSGVYSLYTQQWYMLYRYVDSFRAGAYVPARKLSTKLYDIYHCWVYSDKSWWWTEEMSETCRVSWQNEFVKLVHLVGFITKKFHGANFFLTVLTVACLANRLPTSSDTPIDHYGAAFILSPLGLVDNTLTIYHFRNKFNIIPL